MRLTALLPPPPTPTTFILADSTGANEQLTDPEPERYRFQTELRPVLWEIENLRCNEVDNDGDDALGFDR